MRLIGTSLALLLTGCVTTGEFKQQVEKTENETKRADSSAKEFEAAKKTIDEQKTAMDTDRKSLAEFMTKVKANEDQLGTLQAKLTADDEQIASLQKSNKGLTDTLNASRNDLKQRVSDLTKQGDELNQKISELNQKIAEGAQRNTDLTEKLALAQQEKDALQKQKDDEVERVRRSYENVAASLKSDIEKGAVQIKQLQGKLTLNLVDKVLFKPGEADVNEEGRKVLERIGEVLNNVQDKDIRIEGHTDDKPITGELKARFPTNWELSAARATAVARYLQDHAHVDAKRLIVTGYGQYRPVSSNDTPESRALNRRIELVLVPHD